MPVFLHDQLVSLTLLFNIKVLSSIFVQYFLFMLQHPRYKTIKYWAFSFIIEYSKMSFYYRGLANWNIESGWFRNICLD